MNPKAASPRGAQPRTRTPRRTLLTAVAAVAAALGPLPQLAHADGTATTTPEVTIPAQTATGPVGELMVADGADGHVLQSAVTFYANGRAEYRYSWHSADGTVTRDLGLLGASPVILPKPGGGTLVGAPDLDSGGVLREVGIYDPAAGTWVQNETPVPAGQSLVGIVPTTTGWAAVTRSGTGTVSDPVMLHVLTPAAAGGWSDTPVTGQPAEGIGVIRAWRSTEGAMVIGYQNSSGLHQGLLDTDTGALTYSASTDAGSVFRVVINDHAFGAYDADTARLTLRALDAPQTVVTDMAVSPPAGSSEPVLTDTALVLGRAGAGLMPGETSGSVVSFPLDGSASTVLSTAAGTPLATADTAVAYDTVTGQDSWATDKLPADGGPVAAIRTFATYHPEQIGLSLDRGRLSTVQTGPGHIVKEHLYTADLGTAAAPAAPQPPAWVGEYSQMPWDGIVDRCGGVRCEALTDTDSTAEGTYQVSASVYLSTDLLGKDRVNEPGGQGGVTLDSSGGRIVTADGIVAVYDSGSDGQQYIVDLKNGQVASTRPITAAALWNHALWSATATPGTFTVAPAGASGLPGGPVSTVATDVPCVPDEIQVLGRWLYWSCGASGPAGVYDTGARRSIPVPSGHALLGDGYVLRHVGGQLVLTDVHSGTAAADRVVAALPAGAYDDDRGITWTVDKYRGFLAYTGSDGTTHVLPSGVPASPLGVLRGTVPATATADAYGWQPQWTFTGPAASWRLDIRRRGQTTVIASFSGGPARSGTSGIHWNGRYSSGEPVPDGAYDWTLGATPADGDGPALSTTGSVLMTGGPSIARDFSGDGIGDLFALTSGGRLDLRPGTGTAPGGVRATSSSAAGWPSTDRLIPFGDLNGDAVNDLLVRDGSGNLYCYYGTAGHAFAPGGAHQRIGWGWNIYDVLAAPGDTNGDARPDLIARDTHGDLWLYTATATGTLAARKQVGYGYQIYDTIVGAQALSATPNFPDSGDLLARDRSGVLWEYATDTHGHLITRDRIGAGWNIYNALVGVGDINGDGHNDLVARDGNGDLWFYAGNNNGLFAPRVKIGWGWQTYARLL